MQQPYKHHHTCQLAKKHVDGFVTDSVGIGICNQGVMVGKVAVNRNTVLAHMRLVSRWQIVLMLLLAAGYAVVAYCRKTMAGLRNIKIIGNTCLRLRCQCYPLLERYYIPAHSD